MLLYDRKSPYWQATQHYKSVITISNYDVNLWIQKC